MASVPGSGDRYLQVIVLYSSGPVVIDSVKKSLGKSNEGVVAERLAERCVCAVHAHSSSSLRKECCYILKH